MARIAAGGRSKSPNFSIKTIWGLAKSPELNLNEEELYTIVCRETGKDSLRALSQDEINQVCRALTQLKDGVKKDNGRIRAGMATEKQLFLIRKLEQELGWADNPKRLRKFMQKYYDRPSINWLTFKEASKLIESLKKMRERIARGD